jgi:hypothetical protein
VLVGGVVDNEFGDHTDPAFMGGGDEALHVGERAVIRVHPAIVGDVVPIVEPGGGIERQQPDGVDAEVGDVVETGYQTGKVADAIIV